MSKSSDADTLRFYAQTASVYADEGQDRLWSGLADFASLLPKGGEVLELGCGAGREAAYLHQAGFRVDATDGSPEMVAEAQARTGLPVRVMLFNELRANAAYDGILANASLLHVPGEGLAEILLLIHRALRPGGWHVASFKTGGSAGQDGHGRYFNRPSVDWLSLAYRSAGFPDPMIHESNGGGYRGEASDWLTVTAQRRHGDQ